MPNQARNLGPAQQYFLGRNMGTLRGLPSVIGDVLNYVNSDKSYLNNGNEDREMAERVIAPTQQAFAAYAALCMELLEDNPQAYGDYREVPKILARVGQEMQKPQAEAALYYTGVVGSRPFARLDQAAVALNAIITTPGLSIPVDIVNNLQNAFSEVDLAMEAIKSSCEAIAF